MGYSIVPQEEACNLVIRLITDIRGDVRMGDMIAKLDDFISDFAGSRFNNKNVIPRLEKILFKLYEGDGNIRRFSEKYCALREEVGKIKVGEGFIGRSNVLTPEQAERDAAQKGVVYRGRSMKRRSDYDCSMN